MDTSTIEIFQRVSAIVGQFISVTDDVSREQDLQELGLTSMQMVNLMLSVEAEFDLTIPGAALVPGNFRTIANIERLVRELAH